MFCYEIILQDLITFFTNCFQFQTHKFHLSEYEKEFELV